MGLQRRLDVDHAIVIDDGSLYKSVWWGPVGAQIMGPSSILGVSVKVFLDKVHS